MNTTAMNRIETHMDKLTKLQRKVADYVLSDPIQAAFMTVDQLAHAVDVSTATIVRFSLELGYSGYTEFQGELQEYLKNKAKPSAKLQVSMEHNTVDGEEQDLITANTRLVLSNIERTMEGLSEQTLENIVEKILSAEKIYCAGLRTSACVSSYLGYNLGRMLDAPCIRCENTGNYAEQLRRITENDVLCCDHVPVQPTDRGVYEACKAEGGDGDCLYRRLCLPAGAICGLSACSQDSIGWLSQFCGGVLLYCGYSAEHLLPKSAGTGSK